MAGIFSFLATVVLISLSGVMAPGPITAATIALGARSRYAGLLIAIGHGLIEVPLIFLITLGLGKFLEFKNVRIIIASAGAAFLIWMALGMLKNLKEQDPTAKYKNSSPLVAGMILSASNPYLLVWWATVGLTLIAKARLLGITAFALFAVVHWLCDLLWLNALAWASFKGTHLLSGKLQRVVLCFCAAALICFGVKFIHDASSLIASY